MTLKPYLSDYLLPATFRNLVINDLLEVIGVPLTYFLNDPKGRDYTVYMKAKWDADQAIVQKKSGVEEKTPQTSQARPALPGEGRARTCKKRKQTGSQDIAKYFDLRPARKPPEHATLHERPGVPSREGQQPGQGCPRPGRGWVQNCRRGCRLHPQHLPRRNFAARRGRSRPRNSPTFSGKMNRRSSR